MPNAKEATRSASVNRAIAATARLSLLTSFRVPSGIPSAGEPAINCFDESHPFLEFFRYEIAFRAHLFTDVSPECLPEAGFDRKKFGPSVIFCETFSRGPGSNLAATRLAACGKCNSTLFALTNS